MASRLNIAAAVGASLGLGALATAAQPAAKPAAKPPLVSTAHPAGSACEPGGLFVYDDVSPTPAFPGQTRAPRLRRSTGYRLETAVAHVDHGRTMAFLPDGRFLLGERSGRLRLVAADGTPGPAIAGVPAPEKPSALIGLMDVALDLGFARNRIIYLAYTTPVAPPPGSPEPAPAEFGKPPDGVGHIARARLSDDGAALDAFTVIYEGPRVRRLVAAADGTLFASTLASDSGGPQSLAIDGGKVVHITADGAPAPGNPFIDREDGGRFAWDLGHRDLDGLTPDASGRLWAIEHGPRGGDELNLIQPGRNYGFPVISYGREYSGKPVGSGLSAMPGMEQPVYFWVPSIAPSGLLAYSGKMFPQWRGNLFVGGLVAGSLVRLEMSGDKVVGEEFMLYERCRRVRDVREAPDGSLFVLTDHEDGEVLRLSKR